MYSNDNIILKSLKGSRELKKSKNGNFVYLYKITNLVNLKIYIGVHSCKNKNPFMDNYFGSGIKLKLDGSISSPFKNGKGSPFYNSILKYGVKNFKKEILLFFDDLEDALEFEKEIVNKEFIKSNLTFNKVIGGSLPPFGSGENNSNFGHYWSKEKKDKLKKILKKSKHNKKNNNVKSKKCYLYDLINNKVHKLNYLGQISEFYPYITDYGSRKHIFHYQFYMMLEEDYKLGLDKCIDLYGQEKTKKVYKLIKLYKNGIRNIKKLKQFTGLQGGYINRFLKNIKDESNNY